MTKQERIAKLKKRIKELVKALDRGAGEFGRRGDTIAAKLDVAEAALARLETE